MSVTRSRRRPKARKPPKVAGQHACRVPEVPKVKKVTKWPFCVLLRFLAGSESSFTRSQLAGDLPRLPGAGLVTGM